MEVIDFRNSSLSNTKFVTYKMSKEKSSINVFESKISSLRNFFRGSKIFLSTNISSRSIHLNHLSKYSLFKKIIEDYPNNRDTCFYVESFFEKKVFESLIKNKNQKVFYRISFLNFFKKIFFKNIFTNFIKSFYLTIFFIAGKYYVNQRIEQKKLIFISRNFHVSSINHENYSCRYFGDVFKVLDKEYFANLFNLNDFYNFSSLKKLKNLDIKKSYFVEINLSIGDYFSALFLSIAPLWLSLLYFFKNNKNYENTYISLLIASETFSSSLLRNLFQIKFFNRIKKNKVEVIKFFDWYEGLPLNTAKIIGVRDFHPNANFIGHYGATGEKINLANMIYDSDEDKNLNPDKVSFKGKIFLDNAIQNSSLKRKFTSGPDFRFKSSHQNKISKEAKKLCLVLPYYDEEALNLCKFYREVTNTKVCVKLHPVARYKKTQKYLESNEYLFNEIKFSPLDEGTYSHILTIGTGLTLEAYMKGIVVGIISSSNFFTLDHLVNIAEPEEYKIVTDKNSFYEFMELKPNLYRAVEDLSNFPDKDSINNYFSTL